MLEEIYICTLPTNFWWSTMISRQEQLVHEAEEAAAAGNTDSLLEYMLAIQRECSQAIFESVCQIALVRGCIHEAIVRLLVQTLNVDVDFYNGATLCAAVKAGHFQAVRNFIIAGRATIELDFYRLVSLAAGPQQYTEEEQLEILEFLLEHAPSEREALDAPLPAAQYAFVEKQHGSMRPLLQLSYWCRCKIATQRPSTVPNVVWLVRV